MPYSNCNYCGTQLRWEGVEDGVCDACDQKIADGIIAVMEPSPVAANTPCPDCHGHCERFHNPPNTCCKEGCCWDTCATCGGKGFV